MLTHRKRPRKLYKVNWLKSVKKKRRIKIHYREMARRRLRTLRPGKSVKG